ncbi:TRIC cation channel family protein [Microbacterium horticulturae]|uniref:TRIC cation channel family protein n=1 Tax=Microbacterium horticulturae TaxID=3028316 RepID=A0ABY8C346_9MICO|nr:TRIC cation channel family protein [Microbacterium sp. KACC 23027]WEG09268.1 TRIC cation channel family protein [Microbacterium sp. KACC 23027]
MTWALALDLLGTFFFAISGSLLAAQRGFDIVASLLLGSLTGLGGGVIRDVIIGAPPAAFAEPIHFVAPALAAVLVFFLSGLVQRFSRTLLVFDAGGLAVFCTTGTVTALSAGMNPVAAILLGVTTGVGGGLLRDVVANRDPQLFNPRDLYAVPAFLGAVLIAGLWYLGWYGPVALYAVAVVVFVFRVLSLKFGWRIPHAHGSWPRHPDPA